jgi:hypothetical protein
MRFTGYRNRYTQFEGYEDQARRKAEAMYDTTALDLIRQRQEQFERVAERARLAREARHSSRRAARPKR